MFKPFSRKSLERIKKVWGAERVRSENRAEQSANPWDRNTIQHWLQHPLVQERINLKISGSRQTNRFEYFLQHYLAGSMPVECALTLGSGLGELERGLCQYGFARQHVGVDLSDEAVRIAAEQARAAGFDHLIYRTADLNSCKFERNAYDVVFGISSVHHIHRLEHLFREIAQALRPGGYFFLEEFIGPSRFQWTDTQLTVINEELQRLPKEFRRRISNREKVKERVIRETVEDIVASDPSEAVRSSEIVPLLGQYFRIVEVKGYGGTILHQLMYDIAGNFCADQPGSLDELQRLFELEDQLTASGKLPHDFAVIIATT